MLLPRLIYQQLQTHLPQQLSHRGDDYHDN
jgi:hypothetical protein